MKRIAQFLQILCVCTILSACQNINTEKTAQQIKIVCTTGMIGNSVENIVGNEALVSTLMGPGVDPHLYKATQGDIKILSEADIIIYNGLHLEGKMGDIFHKLQRTKKVIALSDLLGPELLINDPSFPEAIDPHIWFDISIWRAALDSLSNILSSEIQSDSTNIESRSYDFLSQLDVLHDLCREQISQIDSSKRVLITAHDAFKYFGRAYGIEVRGLQGISTAAEYGLNDISQLVNYIVANEIPAIFIESSVSQKSMKAVIEGCQLKGHDLKLGGELFSDAMGNTESPEGNFIGMVEYNLRTITKALK